MLNVDESWSDTYYVDRSRIKLFTHSTSRVSFGICWLFRSNKNLVPTPSPMVRELLDLAFLFYAVSFFCTALCILFVDPLCLVLSLSLLSHFPMSFNFYSLGSLPSSFYVWRTLKFVLVSVLVFTNIFFFCQIPLSPDGHSWWCFRSYHGPIQPLAMRLFLLWHFSTIATIGVV
jgi:hypothetical protein